MNSAYILEVALMDALKADWRLSKWTRNEREEISTAASLDYLE